MGPKLQRLFALVLAGLPMIFAETPYQSGPMWRSIKGNQGPKVEVIRSSTNLVDIFVTVKEGNRFVNGLTLDSFEVYEDGVAQRVAFFEAEDSPVSVAILLDTSASMQKAIGILQTAAVKFVEGLTDKDEATVISFGGMIKELSPLTRNKERLSSVIRQTYAEGDTLLYDAITRAIFKLEGASGRRAIVLITDGADTASQLSVESVVRVSGRMAVPLFIVGEGDALKQVQLRKSLEALAASTGGQAFFLKEAQQLPRAFSEISANLKASYRTGYYLRTPIDGKWHKISVTLKGSKGKVITRQGYYAKAKY
jgi:Ca-activated chloride channel family protein